MTCSLRLDSLFGCLSILVAMSFCSCNKIETNPYADVSLEQYASMRSSFFKVNSDIINKHIASLIRSDADTLYSDRNVRGYYKKGGSYVWITRTGIDERADTLLSFLQSVSADGFSVDKFFVPQISSDLEKLRTLSFDSLDDINAVMARLEYRLTKAYFRYASGTRFGYVNPYKVFNSLDRLSDDSLCSSFRVLYDVDTEVAGPDFFTTLLSELSSGEIGGFLRSIQPANPYYAILRARLSDSLLSRPHRLQILANMERCRWRVADTPYSHASYIVVNIPSYGLSFVSPDTIAHMKVCCGARKTKTPLLSGHVMRIDINPQWVIPKSIIKTDIARHAHDDNYFSSRRYFIRDRRTGKKLPPSEVSADMLLDNDFQVVQEGGAGNSLGRIIFRFANNHSIYLHDTSSPGAFSRTDRSVSHGCIRLEKPYLLASLLLGDKGSVLSRIRYSMTADVSPLGKKRHEMTQEQMLVADTLRKDMLIGSVKVTPQIPLFITYYTLFPDANGNISDLPDVYGYDERILAIIRNFI